MSIESLRRRLVRLHTTKYDYRIGLADRLAAVRAARQGRLAERVSQGLPADLSTEERIAELVAWLESHEHYAESGCLAGRLYRARNRLMRRLEAETKQLTS